MTDDDRRVASDLARVADRSDDLAEVADLMGDVATAQRLRDRAARYRMEAMGLLDE